MRTDALDYELPEELIAQTPAARRDESRLLVLRAPGRAGRAHAIEHRRVRELPELLEPGDLLVVNDARVLPARLRARRRTGGAVELLLLEPEAGQDGAGGQDDPDEHDGADGHDDAGGHDDTDGQGRGGFAPRWRALARPAGRLRVGERLALEPLRGQEPEEARDAREAREAVIVAKGQGGTCSVAFPGVEDVGALLEERGEMPLPPYIRRDPDDARSELDRRRYQTVYAAVPGAVAAPTAGLHFTPELLDALREREVEVARLTLHVGPGTFRPITAERVEEHDMDAERYEIPPGTAAAIAAARQRGGRVVAVGTTVVRALEQVHGEAGRGTAELFISPGYEFGVVDAMLTNFHLPRSTPLFLVAALAGSDAILEAYAEAVERRYRFYSYGDAMLILPCPCCRADTVRSEP